MNAPRNAGRPRILHVITGLDLGGAEMMLLKLAAELRGRVDNTVLSLSGRIGLAPRFAKIGVPVLTMGRQDSGTPFRAPRTTLTGLARSLGPHLIHGWMLHGNLGAWAARTLAARGRPLVWTIRQTVPALARERLRNRPLFLAAALVSQRVDLMISNSHSGETDHLRLGFRPRARRVIPNGFDCRRFAPRPEARARVRLELNIPMDAPVAGLAARWDPLKDHHGFLKAAALVRKELPTARFLLAGPGVDPCNADLRRWIADEGLDGCVHLLGSRSDMPDVLAALDLSVLCSLAEGFPNVVGEAMAAGVPAVVTDVGECAGIVGDAGRVVRPRDPEALATAMRAILRLAPDKRQDLGMRGRRRVERLFAMDKIADDYLSCYRSLITRPDPTGGGRA